MFFKWNWQTRTERMMTGEWEKFMFAEMPSAHKMNSSGKILIKSPKIFRSDKMCLRFVLMRFWCFKSNELTFSRFYLDDCISFCSPNVPPFHSSVIQSSQSIQLIFAHVNIEYFTLLQQHKRNAEKRKIAFH